MAEVALVRMERDGYRIVEVRSLDSGVDEDGWGMLELSKEKPVIPFVIAQSNYAIIPCSN